METHELIHIRHENPEILWLGTSGQKESLTNTVRGKITPQVNP